ncbi:hypothetical protein LJR175_006738 [Variovorax sp. LjRoot175]|uniref:hypothetical protein n=1 Tax=Variovorax sp. LjRoot175 TaxID=3342276 RepID=UPI003ECFE357
MRWRLLTICACFGLIALVSSCTQLEVRRNTGGLIEGIPYALPQKSFLLTVDYEVRRCDVTAGRLLLEVRTTAALTAFTEPGERFYIPYASVHNLLKDTDVTVEGYDNGTVKSVSATITDKTGPAITASIGTVLRLGALGSGAPPIATATERKSDAEVRNFWCAKDVREALDEIASLEAKLKQQEVKNGGAGKKLKAPPEAPVAAAGGVPDPSTRLEELRTALRFRQAHKWTPSKAVQPSGARQLSFTVGPDEWLKSGRWINSEAYDAIKKQIAADTRAQSKFERLHAQVVIDLDRPLQEDPTLVEPLPGYVLRSPSSGSVRLCEGLCPKDSASLEGVVSVSQQILPQMGEYVLLPLKNRLFEKQTLAVSLSAEGTLQKVGVTSTASAAAGLENLNANLDAIKAAQDARDKANEAARSAASSQTATAAKKVTDTNQAVAACLAAQQAVIAAKGRPTGICQ